MKWNLSYCPDPSSRLQVHVFSWCVQLWADVCCCCPQDQSSRHSGEELQETCWRRTPTRVSPWERMKTSGSSCATTAVVNSTSTRSASASGNATMATFTEEPLKQPGQIKSHPFLSSRENWRCLLETDVSSSEDLCPIGPFVFKKAFFFRSKCFCE